VATPHLPSTFLDAKCQIKLMQDFYKVSSSSACQFTGFLAMTPEEMSQNSAILAFGVSRSVQIPTSLNLTKRQMVIYDTLAHITDDFSLLAWLEFSHRSSSTFLYFFCWCVEFLIISSFSLTFISLVSLLYVLFNMLFEGKLQA